MHHRNPMHALRRHKLRNLLEHKFHGDREKFLDATGLSKGRLSQLLDENEPFGEVAARNLETRLHLDPGYFDAMDSRTVAFALAFEALSPSMKTKWEQIAKALQDPPSGQ